MNKKRWLVLTAAGALAAMAGTAWATGAVSSIVAADGAINGCYRAKGGDHDEGQKGQLRVVAAGEQCKKNELAIQWSKKGPKGETGAQGVAGQAGLKGDSGAPGAAGAKGDTGTAGATGLAGTAGATGAQGILGERGPKGDTGAIGATGTVGATGPLGLPGPQGSPGPAGLAGGVAGWEVRWVTIAVAPFDKNSAYIPCPAGKKVTGGGFQNGNYLFQVQASYPSGDGNGWLVAARNDGDFAIEFFAYAVCVG